MKVTTSKIWTTCVDNNKVDLREIGWDRMDWIVLDQWRALVKTIMNLPVP
jgi:hypothetical protein